MLINVARENMNKALKAKDADSRRVYSLILDALEKKEKEKRAPLTEAEEGEVILRLMKMADETLKSIPDTSVEIIRETEYEKTVYAIYAPAQMTKEMIDLAIETVIYKMGVERPTVKHKGLLMKNLMPIVKGKADGQLVNRLVDERLAD